MSRTLRPLADRAPAPFRLLGRPTPAQRGHPHIRTQASFGSLLPADLNVGCLRSLLPLRHLERDLRALVQLLEPAASDGRDVHEQIFAALIGRDEAVALLAAEPLDGSGCHEHTSLHCSRMRREGMERNRYSFFASDWETMVPRLGKEQGDASSYQTVLGGVRLSLGSDLGVNNAVLRERPLA